MLNLWYVPKPVHDLVPGSSKWTASTLKELHVLVHQSEMSLAAMINRELDWLDQQMLEALEGGSEPQVLLRSPKRAPRSGSASSTEVKPLSARRSPSTGPLSASAVPSLRRLTASLDPLEEALPPSRVQRELFNVQIGSSSPNPQAQTNLLGGTPPSVRPFNPVGLGSHTQSAAEELAEPHTLPFDPTSGGTLPGLANVSRLSRSPLGNSTVNGDLSFTAISNAIRKSAARKSVGVVEVPNSVPFAGLTLADTTVSTRPTAVVTTPPAVTVNQATSDVIEVVAASPKEAVVASPKEAVVTSPTLIPHPKVTIPPLVVAAGLQGPAARRANKKSTFGFVSLPLRNPLSVKRPEPKGDKVVSMFAAMESEVPLAAPPTHVGPLPSLSDPPLSVSEPSPTLVNPPPPLSEPLPNASRTPSIFFDTHPTLPETPSTLFSSVPPPGSNPSASKQSALQPLASLLPAPQLALPLVGARSSPMANLLASVGSTLKRAKDLLSPKRHQRSPLRAHETSRALSPGKVTKPALAKPISATAATASAKPRSPLRGATKGSSFMLPTTASQLRASPVKPEHNGSPLARRGAPANRLVATNLKSVKAPVFTLPLSPLKRTAIVTGPRKKRRLDPSSLHDNMFYDKEMPVVKVPVAREEARRILPLNRKSPAFLEANKNVAKIKAKMEREGAKPVEGAARLGGESPAIGAPGAFPEMPPGGDKLGVARPSVRVGHVKDQALGSLGPTPLLTTIPNLANTAAPTPIPLPEIFSELEDDEHGLVLQDWAEVSELTKVLLAQRSVDPDQIFGPIAPLRMEEIFNSNLSRMRSRNSSSWMGQDKLTLEEINQYREKMGYRD